MAITLDGSNLTTGGVINVGTAVASTSGTAITFTGIPSTAKRITVMLQGVTQSASGNSFLLRVGTSGGVVTTGYVGGGARSGASSIAGTSYTTGFGFNNTTVEGFNGSIVLTNLNGNVWTAMGIIAGTSTENADFTSGSISLGGVLTQISFTTVNGTNTFTAGSINIFWE